MPKLLFYAGTAFCFFVALLSAAMIVADVPSVARVWWGIAVALLAGLAIASLFLRMAALPLTARAKESRPRLPRRDLRHLLLDRGALHPPPPSLPGDDEPARAARSARRSPPAGVRHVVVR